MRTNGSKKAWAWLGAGLLALSVACGDDKGEEAGDETASTETGDGDGDGDQTGDGDGDQTGDGDGDETGDGDGDETGDGDGDETGDGDGDQTGDGDGDGEPNPECLELDNQADCEAHPDCQSVIGSPIKKNGPDSPCLEPAEFLGCIGTQGCGDAITYFCQNNNTWQLPDTCGPDFAEPCEGPEEPVDACP
ncbi:MAG: hypothetical protein R6X02_33460 [Enhygromyxa sp.]